MCLNAVTIASRPSPVLLLDVCFAPPYRQYIKLKYVVSSGQLPGNIVYLRA